MRYLFIWMLLGYFVVIIHSRPSQPEENNENQDEAEYEGDNGSPAEENLEDSRFGDEDSAGRELEQNQRLLEINRNNYLQKNLAEDHGPRTNSDTPDFKPTRSRDIRNDKFSEAVNTNEEFQTYGKRRRYIENSDANDQLEVAQHLTNRDVNNYKNNRVHDNVILDDPLSKRTVGSKKAHTDEGELLFENNNHDQISKVNKNVNFNEPLDLNQRPSYPKQYYNQMQSDNIAQMQLDNRAQMQSDNRALLDANSRSNEYFYYNRDRREAKKSNPGDTENIANVETSSNESSEKADNENEELAIKRHIKKMSGYELEQLLNSLSEDKRTLLKKIIDDVDITEKKYDNINKREITKKAGVVEQNAFIDSSQSESSKIQSGFTAMDPTTTLLSPKNLEPTETTKQTENQADTTDLISQKSLQETNSADLKNNNDNNLEKSDNSLAPNTDSNKNQAELASNDQILSKNENKRETNFENGAQSFEDLKMLGIEKNNDESYFFPQSEDLSKLIDVEQSRSYDSSKIYKREVENQAELDSKLKSLEESFPNSDAYDESGPYTGPLIRVKRKSTEQAMKKRSAAVLPDAKVGYCPYKAESNDDDTDEGNEFDDDGFYDPSPNFVNDNKNSDVQDTRRDDVNCKLNTKDQSKLPISDANGGTMNLGSDTDNVLSSVEGVDENLMFSSGTRSRRKTEGSIVERIDGNNLVQPAQGVDSETKSLNNNLNIPNYQDSDSFGGFPRNYEGDLGRYKRIRRVKQSHASEAPPSA